MAQPIPQHMAQPTWLNPYHMGQPIPQHMGHIKGPDQKEHELGSSHIIYITKYTPFIPHFIHHLYNKI